MWLVDHYFILPYNQILDESTNAQLLKPEGYPMPNGEIFVLNEGDDSEEKVDKNSPFFINID